MIKIVWKYTYFGNHLFQPVRTKRCHDILASTEKIFLLRVWPLKQQQLLEHLFQKLSAFSVMLFFYLLRCILYLLILYECLILGQNFFNKCHRRTYHKISNESLMIMKRSLMLMKNKTLVLRAGDFIVAKALLNSWGIYIGGWREEISSFINNRTCCKTSFVQRFHNIGFVPCQWNITTCWRSSHPFTLLRWTIE